MLAICTSLEGFPQVETRDFQVGEFYRHLPLTDGEKTEHMVYGVVFDNDTFNKCFKVYNNIIKVRARNIFYVDGKPLTKKAFKEDYVNIHQYGSRTTGFKVAYIGHPKENCFGIRMPNTTKAELIKFAYETMLELCDGEVDAIDGCYAKWFNTGIRISMSTQWFGSTTDSEYKSK